MLLRVLEPIRYFSQELDRFLFVEERIRQEKIKVIVFTKPFKILIPEKLNHSF